MPPWAGGRGGNGGGAGGSGGEAGEGGGDGDSGASSGGEVALVLCEPPAPSISVGGCSGGSGFTSGRDPFEPPTTGGGGGRIGLLPGSKMGMGIRTGTIFVPL